MLVSGTPRPVGLFCGLLVADYPARECCTRPEPHNLITEEDAGVYICSGWLGSAQGAEHLCDCAAVSATRLKPAFTRVFQQVAARLVDTRS